MNFGQSLKLQFGFISKEKLPRSRPGYLAASRKRLVEQISQEEQSPLSAKFPIFGWKLPVFRLAFAAFAFIMVVFAFRGGNYLVQASLPGDQLYNVKLAAEDVRLSMASDPIAEAELRIQLGDVRAKEIEDLFEKGRFESIPYALVNYKTNLKIAADLIANLKDSGSREVALAQTLAATVAGHNQSFSSISKFQHTRHSAQ